MEYLPSIYEKALKSKKFIKWRQRLLLLSVIFTCVLLVCKFVLQIHLLNFPIYIYISNIVICVGLFILFHIKDRAIVDENLSEIVIELPSEIRTQIELYFENNRSFLNTSFSFNDLVTDLKLPKNDVSKTINHEMNSNFYNLLAEKRIEVAKELLSQNKGKMKIDALLHQCGFISTTSFNYHFKKHVGTTPSLFQKNNY